MNAPFVVEDSLPLVNPVLSGALSLLTQSIAQGEAVDDMIERAQATIQSATSQAAQTRAEKLQAYCTPISESENQATLTNIFTDLALKAKQQNLKSKQAAFDYFQAEFSRSRVGIVFTAHPTFAVDERILRLISKMAGGHPLSDQQQTLLETQDHRPQEAPTLETENQQIEQAIAGARQALRQILEILFKVAQTHFPDEWTSFTPCLADVATWVGGDIDGRTDIGWSQSFSLRLQAQARQFDWLGSRITSLIRLPGSEDIRAGLQNLGDDLTALSQRRWQMANELSQIKPDDLTAISQFSRDFLAAHTDRPDDKSGMDQSSDIDPEIWLDRLDQLLRQVDATTETATALAVVRAEFAATGLSASHLHVRMNATQIHNALRHDLSLEGDPMDSAFRREALRKLVTALSDVQPVRVNFGSLMREQSSARRMFMLVRQILHHIDSTTPVRILIAECDSIFTILGALYLAKRYGIEEKVDISPLLETPSALENGAQIMADLLCDESYQAYVQKRGRISIQTGFSDAGRHCGQIAAALAVERFQTKLASCLSACSPKMPNETLGKMPELVLFNTHGESLGRGAHPKNLMSRLRYLYAPYVRRKFGEINVPVKHETSFQGGDGMVFFLHPDMAFATMARIIEDGFDDPGAAAPDSFYQTPDQSLDFFLTLQYCNQHMMDNPDFGAVLTRFAPALLYPTGSRQTQRQQETASALVRSVSARMRAIPQNAVLMQLGWLATVTYGLGQAVARDPDWFRDQLAQSDRLQTLIAMSKSALERWDTDILLAYLELYNPAFWLHLARHSGNALPKSAQRAMRQVARLLSQDDFYEKSMRIACHLMQDAQEFAMELPAGFLDTPDPNISEQDKQHAVSANNSDLHPLHQLRLALIMRLFLQTPDLPAFSNHPDIRIDDVMQACLRLDVEAAVADLRRAFPATDRVIEADFAEPADINEDDFDYSLEHKTLFAPLLALKDEILRITLALSHQHGTIG